MILANIFYTLRLKELRSGPGGAMPQSRLLSSTVSGSGSFLMIYGSPSSGVEHLQLKLRSSLASCVWFMSGGNIWIASFHSTREQQPSGETLSKYWSCKHLHSALQNNILPWSGQKCPLFFVCWRYHKTSVTDGLLSIIKQIDIKRVNLFIKSFNIN